MRVGGIEFRERGVVPKQAVAVTGHDHRDGNLRVQLPKLLRHSTPVPNAFLKLTETIKKFIRRTGECLLRLKGRFAVHRRGGHGFAAGGGFGEQQIARRIGKRHRSGRFVHGGFQFARGNRDFAAGLSHLE